MKCGRNEENEEEDSARDTMLRKMELGEEWSTHLRMGGWSFARARRWMEEGGNEGLLGPH